MRKWYAFAAVAVVPVLAIPAAYRSPPLVGPELTQQETPFTGPNYLYIEEYEIARGMVPNEAIAEAQGWVKVMRETGEFKSVRLFVHNTGPRFALYILAETDNWQSIEAGFEKMLAALPDWMDQPFRWGKHSDNLLSEIAVE
jgi:hypothetical protein